MRRAKNTHGGARPGAGRPSDGRVSLTTQTGSGGIGGGKVKDRLLACPFCGSKAKITLRSDGGIQVNCLNAVECWSAIGPLYPWDKTKREAKRIVTKVTGKWNRRKGVSQTSTNKEQYGKDRELAVKNITSKLKPVANGTDRDVQVHELLIKLSNAAARCAFDAGFAYASALAKAAANPPP